MYALLTYEIGVCPPGITPDKFANATRVYKALMADVNNPLHLEQLQGFDPNLMPIEAAGENEENEENEDEVQEVEGA